jgi:tRNA(fMet)-specific endonuclease VapC
MMTTFLFDTDMLSLAQRQHPRVNAALTEHSTDTICIASTTIEEQIDGWKKLASKAKKIEDVVLSSTFLASLVISWNQFGIATHTSASLEQFQTLVARKLNIGKNDLRIGALALTLNATLVTRNLRDFTRIPLLKLENWAD